MPDEVLIERRGAVALLTLNRPEARNAINRAAALALEEALAAADADDEVRAIVLTGAGDKAFSAGMDLKAFAAGELPFTDHGFAGIVTHVLAKPVIAAVNGPALAGGFEIVLSCDLVVAADTAIFGIPEAQRGLVAGAGGLVRLPRRIPLAQALELALVADPISAARASELGLVNRVVPASELVDTAVALGERIARNAPLAVATSKRVIRETVDLPEADAWPINDAAFAAIGASADALEGAVAFAEKRPPRWTGR